MGKGLNLEELKEIFSMEQELDIPMKDRFHKNLTEEELQNLTEVKNYPTETEEESETDTETIKAKIEK